MLLTEKIPSEFRPNTKIELNDDFCSERSFVWCLTRQLRTKVHVNIKVEGFNLLRNSTADSPRWCQLNSAIIALVRNVCKDKTELPLSH